MQEGKIKLKFIGNCVIRELTMEYSDFMNSFVLRVDIFDDLTYLQKHLRMIVKFHQVSVQLGQLEFAICIGRWMRVTRLPLKEQALAQTSAKINFSRIF